MTSSDPVGRRSAVRCETHGLLYDAADSRGCVLCRREAGVPPDLVPAASSAPSNSGPAWLATAILILLTTAILFFAHDQAIQAFHRWTGEEPGILGGGPGAVDPNPQDLDSQGLDTQDLDTQAYGEGPIARELQELNRDLKRGQEEAKARAEKYLHPDDE